MKRKIMATDYDILQKSDDGINEESIDELKVRRTNTKSSVVDDDSETEIYELPETELSTNEELFVKVLPAQDDEFTCNTCFLVRHKSQIAKIQEKNIFLCKECEFE